MKFPDIIDKTNGPSDDRYCQKIRLNDEDLYGMQDRGHLNYIRNIMGQFEWHGFPMVVDFHPTFPDGFYFYLNQFSHSPIII